MKYRITVTVRNREIKRTETNDIKEAKRIKINYQTFYNGTVRIIDNETNEEVITKNHYRTTRVYRNNYIKFY